MDADKHSKLTGSEVTIDRNIGSEFSVYSGDIQGVNLELVPDHKIVQRLSNRGVTVIGRRVITQKRPFL